MNNQNVEKLQPTGIFTNYIFKAIPLAFDESMSYYETLCGLLDYLKNTIIPTLNNNADVIIEYVQKFEELQSFVDNYFTNLDVQEEINNKLDEMVEDGTMDALINTNLTGSLNDLETTDKSNLVSAINEVNGKTSDNATNIGTLSNLDTTEKSNIVDAINEVINDIGDVDDKFNYLNDEEIIGKWIDNTTLYRKVITVQDLTPDDQLGDTKLIEHNISNLNEVVSLKCIANNGDDAYFDFNNYTWYELNETEFTSTCHIFVNNQYIIVTYQGSHYLQIVDYAYFILEYTKTQS